MPSEPYMKSCFFITKMTGWCHVVGKVVERPSIVKEKTQSHMWQKASGRLIPTPSKHFILAEQRMLKQVKNSSLRFSPPRQC